jgi:branched-chain amino acid transport system ATP-binding protein
LEKGKLTCLVGGNGVGKTTLLRTVMGLIRPWKGSIAFENQDVSRLPAYTKAEMGMVLVPEGRQLFTDMSVYENLEMGASTSALPSSRRTERVYVCSAPERARSTKAACPAAGSTNGRGARYYGLT